METIGLAIWDFGKKIPTSLSKYATSWLLLRGVTIWTTWVEWQGILEYANIAWDIACKKAHKVAIYVDVIGVCDNMWG